MRFLSLVFGFSLTVSSAWCQEEPDLGGEDWILLYASEGASLSAKSGSLQSLADGVVAIWFLESTRDRSDARSPERVRRRIVLRELDCTRRTVRPLRTGYGREGGEGVDSWSWEEASVLAEPVAMGTVAELVWNRFCGGLDISPTPDPQHGRTAIPADQLEPGGGSFVLEHQPETHRGQVDAAVLGSAGSFEGLGAPTIVAQATTGVRPFTDTSPEHPTVQGPSVGRAGWSVDRSTAESGEAARRVETPSVGGLMIRRNATFLAGAGILGTLFLAIGGITIAARRSTGSRAGATRAVREAPITPLVPEGEAGPSGEWLCRWCNSYVEEDRSECWICDSPRRTA
jgi:hypothetical protein